MHVPTNRGIYTLVTAAVSAATDIRMGVITDGQAFPDPAAIVDMNFVSDLLAVATEAQAAGYSRVDLANVTVAEDDTSNAVAITADAASWATVAEGESWAGAFFYLQNADDSAAVLLSVHRRDVAGTPTPLPTNGGSITAPGFTYSFQRPA
ncbi:hypothetical protein [Desertimonas flava]|uniref:hypothetical protein n=1 Tax=Desertimonas flava TaxID=2064846 RepID=UPI000E3430F3|nr:hypothetical protein [Desertimonas flava]